MLLAVLPAMIVHCAAQAAERSYPLAPTGQRACYGTTGNVIACGARGEPLGGQDAFFAKTALRYRDNGDGTVSDLDTGLVWQKTMGAKLTWEEAKAGAAALRLGGHNDWRLPTIKELYSLMDFSGYSPGLGRQGRPFIATGYFDFRYGDPAAGERPIDVQVWSATEYAGRTMGGNPTVFGVNFADGRIKGYPKSLPGRGEHRMLARYVRGNPGYGRNDFPGGHPNSSSDGHFKIPQ
jgi:hypothetical protein